MQHLLGADDADCRHFVRRVLGVQSDAKEGTPVFEAYEELIATIVGIGYALVQTAVAIEQGADATEEAKALAADGAFPEESCLEYAQRAQEVVAACGRLQLSPAQLTSGEGEEESNEASTHVSRKDVIRNCYDQLTLGVKPEEISADLRMRGFELDVVMMWKVLEIVRKHQGSDTELLAKAMMVAPRMDHKKMQEMLADAVRADKRRQKNPAWQILDEHLEFERSNAKSKYWQIPLCLVISGLLVLTPIWWLSLVVGAFLFTALVTVRIVLANNQLKAVIQRIQTTFPEESEEYIDAYRLYSRIRDWDGIRNTRFIEAYKALKSVDISEKKTVATTDFAFHGCFYQPATETSEPVKLPFSPAIKTLLPKLLAGPMRLLSEKDYWCTFCPIAKTDQPMGYLSWKNASLWLIAAPDYNDQAQAVDGTFGLHLVEFTESRIRQRFLPFDEPGTGDIARQVIDCVFSWKCHGVGDSRARKFQPSEMKQLDKNTGWLTLLHRRLSTEYPNHQIPKATAEV